jgi:hypothetical protein
MIVINRLAVRGEGEEEGDDDYDDNEANPISTTHDSIDWNAQEEEYDAEEDLEFTEEEK